MAPKSFKWPYIHTDYFWYFHTSTAGDELFKLVFPQITELLYFSLNYSMYFDMRQSLL